MKKIKKDDFDKIVFKDSDGREWSVGMLKELVEAVKKKKESEETFDFYFYIILLVFFLGLVDIRKGLLQLYKPFAFDPTLFSYL